MKTVLTIAFVIFSWQLCFAQTVAPNDEYVQYIYNSETNSKELSYNYSNKWDFDGDKRNDSLFFIGNGGAHTYFYLRIILSSDGRQRDFRSVHIDMPYFVSREELLKWGKNPGIQFIVSDFNDDGVSDIYLNFNNPFGHIPANWKNNGIKTKYVVLSFKERKEIVKDYVWTK